MSYTVTTREEAMRIMDAHKKAMIEELEAAKREGREPVFTECYVLVSPSGKSHWIHPAMSRLP